MRIAIMVARAVLARAVTPGRWETAPAPFGRSAEQARFPALELTRSIGYGPAPGTRRALQSELRSRFLGSIGSGVSTIQLSTIQFDHQWEDIDVEA
jgi:hypothetical protein